MRKEWDIFMVLIFWMKFWVINGLDLSYKKVMLMYEIECDFRMGWFDMSYK